ncbi:Peptide chain release factor RF2 [Roseimaritima ulvae]|uniref:Peptide chain release factor 2 n=1 Tax=Roseimaritima ulvae TaxID=980254 RepID=A0A5B9QSC0_9BACT|nr:peptide chain release factor 2 [Roseimaritima ulvae]QEG40620.1 Peptide chain release factor RF2 [Roseimaritima ulvae]
MKRLASVWSNYETVFDYSAKQQAIKDIELQMGEAGFWDNSESAQQTVATLKGLKGIVDPMRGLIASADDLDALMEMADEEPEMADEVRAEIGRLEAVLDSLELKALLNGPNDAAGALLTINARDGGTDANDWADMMLRMYSAWAVANDFKIELLDRHDNEEAGINHATIAVRGPMAYGYLKGEEGIHRLVRISPFNSEGKRQTSFAAVDVSPEIDDSIDIDIQDKDVREDRYRAGGAGGQHVNKTDSAIRLTHIPTNTVVQCQNERSQHQNRATAWKMLRAKMARIEESKREAEQANKYANKASTGFGSQIRNYFLHPDQRVKDARTGHYVGNFQAVMDGSELQGFLDAFLRWRAKEMSDAKV